LKRQSTRAGLKENYDVARADRYPHVTHYKNFFQCCIEA
jgi:hypothetical protein